MKIEMENNAKKLASLGLVDDGGNTKKSFDSSKLLAEFMPMPGAIPSRAGDIWTHHGIYQIT